MGKTKNIVNVYLAGVLAMSFVMPGNSVEPTIFGDNSFNKYLDETDKVSLYPGVVTFQLPLYTMVGSGINQQLSMSYS